MVDNLTNLMGAVHHGGARELIVGGAGGGDGTCRSFNSAQRSDMPIDKLCPVSMALYPTHILLRAGGQQLPQHLIWRLPKMLERDWRQAQDVLGLPGETPLPTSLSTAARNARIAGIGNSGVGKYSRCSVTCGCAAAHSACAAPSANAIQLTELACGLLSAFIAWHFGTGWQSVSADASDLGSVGDEPDRHRASIAARCVGAALVVAGVDRPTVSACSYPLHAALWGAVAGYLLLWSGCSNCSPARTSATVISSYWRCSARGATGRFCR